MHRLLITLLSALAVLSLVLPSDVTVGRALPQALTNPPDWELTSLTEPALRLFTPSSGVLFAQTTTEVVRSDDAGDTWETVPVGAPPPFPSALEPSSRPHAETEARPGLP